MGRDNSISVIVRKHAEAPTRENAEALMLTPTQAALTWWALHGLRETVATIPVGRPYDDEYADILRCRADAIDWATQTMIWLAEHCKNNKVEIAH
jgi:hypothetical protein